MFSAVLDAVVVDDDDDDDDHDDDDDDDTLSFHMQLRALSSSRVSTVNQFTGSDEFNKVRKKYTTNSNATLFTKNRYYP